MQRKSTYTLLRNDLQENASTQHRTRQSILCYTVFVCLVISLSLNGVLLSQTPNRGSNPPTGDSITHFSERKTVLRVNGYHENRYTDENITIADAAWDAIELGHGIVQLPREYALQHGLALSRAWKPDRSAAIYAFSAYHAMHCVVHLHVNDMIRLPY